MKNQKCPICGVGTLKKDIGNESFKYKDKSITIKNYVVYKCGACGESIVDKATLRESGRILKDFQREVDGLLSAGEIKNIRKRLDLTQEEMAEILGGGLKSFARYETGQICQSRAMDNLLRVLCAFPQAIQILEKAPAHRALYRGRKVISLEKYKSRYKTRTDDFMSGSKGISSYAV